MNTKSAAHKKSSKRRSQGRPSRVQATVGRAALVESTRKLLQQKPPGKVTRAEIARFAGVNPALIRYYFGDKSALLTAVVEAISQENLRRLRDTLMQEGTTAKRLARRVRLLLQMHIENPSYHQLIFEQLWQGTRSEQKRLGRAMVIPYYEEFSKLFADGRRRGELRDIDPRFVHVAIIGLCELFINAPYVLQELFQIRNITPDVIRRYGDFVVDLLLHGIGQNRPELELPTKAVIPGPENLLATLSQTTLDSSLRGPQRGETAVRIVKSEPWYKATLGFVQERHQGRVDKLGWPYYQHFERVADRLVRLFPQATQAQVQAALLHDAAEPEGCAITELESRGVLPEAIAIIRRIALPQDGRSYLAYIADLVSSGDEAAIQVKLADNLDAVEFYSTRTDAESRRMLETRYEPARKMLQNGLSAVLRVD